MRPSRLTGMALAILAAGIVIATMLGPLGMGIVRFRVSVSAEHQLAGGEIASLALAVPASLAAGWAWWRGSRLGPLLAIAPGAYAVYMYVQYIAGPEYHRYAGNNERAFPLYLGLVLLGGGIAARAWIALGRIELAAPSAAVRRSAGCLMVATGGLFALAWIASIAAVLRDAPSDEYLRDPQLFWLVRLMDLGAVIPLALLVGTGLLRATSWSTRAAGPAAMFMALLVAAVAGMALRLQLAGDPAADPVFAVATAALALAWLATTTLLVREVAGSSRRLVVHRDPRGPMTARDRPGNL